METWVKVAPISGTGNKNIMIQTEKNLSIQDRETSLNTTASTNTSIKKQIKISQKGMEFQNLKFTTVSSGQLKAISLNEVTLGNSEEDVIKVIQVLKKAGAGTAVLITVVEESTNRNTVFYPKIIFDYISDNAIIEYDTTKRFNFPN